MCSRVKLEPWLKSLGLICCGVQPIHCGWFCYILGLVDKALKRPPDGVEYTAYALKENNIAPNPAGKFDLSKLQLDEQNKFRLSTFTKSAGQRGMGFDSKIINWFRKSFTVPKSSIVSGLVISNKNTTICPVENYICFQNNVSFWWPCENSVGFDHSHGVWMPSPVNHNIYRDQNFWHNKIHSGKSLVVSLHNGVKLSHRATCFADILQAGTQQRTENLPKSGSKIERQGWRRRLKHKMRIMFVHCL